ncbi:MAG: DNRLRE domain-containing protein, partial [Clostridiaceae bacterium]
DYWDDPSMTIRMNNTGTFDVRNGAAFAAATSIAYSANSTYHIRMITDLVNKKYDVWITPPGGSETKITNNYDFRTGAPAIDDLGKINLKDDQNDRYTITNHTVSPVPSLDPVTFNPVADAFVRDGSYAEEEYGTSWNVLALKENSSAGYNRRSYLKFNFSSLGYSSASLAKLRVYVYSADPSTSRTITAYGNITESWSESTINWNNKPDQAGDTTISSATANGTPTGTWLEFDVTSYINSQMTDKLVSIELKNGGADFISLNSREMASNKPQLVITPQ